MNIEKTIIAVAGTLAGAVGIVASFGLVVGIGIGVSIGTVAGLAGMAVDLAETSPTLPSRPTA